MFDKHKIAEQIGSFWLDNMEPTARRQALALSTSVIETSNFELSKLIGAYAANVPEMPTGSFALRYTPRQVVHVAPHVATFVLPGYVVNSGVCDRDALGLSAEDEVWIIPVDTRLVVDSIVAKNGVVWVSGIDFVGVLGFVVLFENPTINFTYGVVPVKAGRLQAPGLLRGLHDLKQTPAGCGSFVSAYRGGNRTADNMVRAAAEYAGYLVFQDDCKIISVEREGPGYRYVTSSGVYFAAYGHTPVTVGAYVEAGHIAGLDYEVFTKDMFDTTHTSSTRAPAPGQFLQYLTGTVDGETLPDAVGALTAPAVICDVPCVVFDDVGDKAVFSLAGIPDDSWNFDIRLTFEVDQADEVIFFELGVEENEMSDFIRLEVDTYSILFTVHDESENWFRISIGKTITPNLFDNPVSVRLVRTNSALSVYLNDDLLESDDYETSGYTDTILTCTPKQGTFNPHPNASWTCKYFYLNLDGYEAEFNFEEGAGNILNNTKDSSANARITSTSGLEVMRAGRVNGVPCSNAYNGCCKVSGTYYADVPDGEFVYIPADENMIAQDPTMVPGIELSIDGTSFFPAKISDAQHNGHTLWNITEYVPWLPHQFLGLTVFFQDGRWRMLGNICDFKFAEPQSNQYLPRGTFDVIDVNEEDRQYSLTIRYVNDMIDDSGKIITPNLNCMPGKVHNGANYNVMQTAAPTEFPTGSRWFNGTTAARLTQPQITDASLTADFAARTIQSGIHKYCQVEATAQYVENTFAGMSQEDMDAVRVFMGFSVCNSDAAQVLNWWDSLIAEIPHDYLLDMFCSKKGIKAYTNNTAQLVLQDLFSAYWVYDDDTLGAPDFMRDLNKLVALYETDNPDKTTLYAEFGPRDYTSTFNMFFEYVLGECAIVVKLKTGNTTLNDRMVDFFKEERPASKYVITIGNVGA